MLDKKKLEAIYKHYGFVNQVLKVKEETEELRFACTSDKIEDFLEELADVYVLISQFLAQSEFKDKIIKIANYKIDRELRRIINETEKEIV
ncbi:MAG: hypothetical protein ACFFG0_03650 [Candidatus Thorarchaeota archaeon]